ncbi:hypothetical protein YYG_00702 [Plasmodium vinckei petteri]|uniref:PIR protein CIR protein n=1 Tax=Plasmodium vinckei petteri TaxID=138298 RepID=W7AYC9_PLAVN|nr:hypothetical protein YYG_00702 [Plasmodium vinckei petteri]
MVKMMPILQWRKLANNHNSMNIVLIENACTPKTKKRLKQKITLNEAYNKYLKKNIDNFEYWNLLGNVKGLKDANLRHMNEFYKLLNHMCKTIAYHKFNYIKSTSFLQNSTNSFNQYMLLYQNVSECDSYLHLLDNLKKTYDEFRITIKEINPKLTRSLQTFTTIKNIDSYFADSFKEFDFSDSKCKLRYDEKKLINHEKAKSRGKQKDNGANGDNIKQSIQPQSSVTQAPNPSAETGTSPSIPGNGANTLESKDKVVGDSQNKSNLKGSDTGNKTNLQSNPSSHTPISGANQGGVIDSVPGTPDITITSSTRDIPVASSFGMNLNVATNLFYATTSFETIKKTIAKATDTIKNLYSTTLTNLETAYDKYSTRDGLSTSNDSPSPQENSPQTSSETSNTSLSLKKGLQKPVLNAVIKQENPGTEAKGNGITKIGDIYVLKEYRQIGISIRVLSIPITLAIMYKHLSYEWRKELKKKIINSIGGKRPMQIIIKSVDTKKMIYPVINPVSGKKTSHY